MSTFFFLLPRPSKIGCRQWVKLGTCGSPLPSIQLARKGDGPGTHHQNGRSVPTNRYLATWLALPRIAFCPASLLYHNFAPTTRSSVAVEYTTARCRRLVLDAWCSALANSQRPLPTFSLQGLRPLSRTRIQRWHPGSFLSTTLSGATTQQIPRL